jgi:glycosyltransferase involved in cell wall biosynthesis
MAAISIIIPTFNRGPSLSRTLQSVATVVVADEAAEIIIVDNGSTDQTPDVYRAVKDNFPKLPLRYFRERVPGLLSGRHRGAKEARGDVLAFLDDDVLLAPGWLDALRDAFRDPAVGLVGGPSRPRYDGDPPAWLDAFWSECEGGRYLGELSLIDLGTEKKPIDPCFVFGLNFSVRKSVFQACRGFHPDLVPKALQRYQGDGETGLSLKISKLGSHAALYHPDVAVTHMIPMSRLTLVAFEQRGFYQGVCDSYTRIRSEGVMPPAPGRAWKDPLRPLKRNLRRAVLSRRCDAKSVRELLGRSHAMGVAFHREEVRNDPTLMNWVLKPDYLDYSLPAPVLRT